MENSWPAIKEYTSTIDLIPYFRAYFRRAYAYHLLEEHQKAIDNYTFAINLLPSYAYAYFNRGIVFFDRGDIEEAIDDWETVLRIEPEYAEAREYHEKAKDLLEQKVNPPVPKPAIKPAPASAPPPPPPPSPKYNITIYTFPNNNNGATQMKLPPNTNIKIIPILPEK